MTDIDNESDILIDLNEMKYFSQHSTIERPCRKLSEFEQKFYSIMASKIQKAWRKYKTAKIIQTYTLNQTNNFQINSFLCTKHPKRENKTLDK